jgi:exodeoxyribonuclease V alpha subunit
MGHSYRVRVTEALFPSAGETYSVEGRSSKFRDNYGRSIIQIEASNITRIATSGRLLAGYLTTLTNVGEARAKRLLEQFGDEIHEVLQDASRVDELGTALQPDRPNFGKKLAACVQADYSEKLAREQVQIDQFRFYARLESLGVQDRSVALKLWTLLGSSKATDVLLANPYLSATLLPWGSADALGVAILRSKGVTNVRDRPERLLGAADAATRALLKEGHTAASETLWLKKCPKGVHPSKMLSEALRDGALIKEGGLIRPLGARYLENGIAEMLERTARLSSYHTQAEIDHIVLQAEADIGFRLTDEQRLVVGEVLGRPLAVLQGGAGVGKTTVMSAVALGWEALGGNVLMAALAGKAALQLSRATSRPGKPRLAVTIARLTNSLRSLRDGKPAEYLPNIEPNTLIIIDEASMVDTPTLHELLTVLRELQPNGIRLLFVGDAGQLPPVGFGSTFHKLVKTRLTSRLTKTLRQAEGSDIPIIAGAIREGTTPDLRPYHRQMEGVYLIEADRQNLINSTAAIYKHVRTYAEVEEIMVCAARNETVDQFNKLMAAANWESAKRLGINAKVFPGDPVICTKNHYVSGLVNGMLGVVKDIHGEVLIAWDADALDSETGKPMLRRVPSEVSMDVKLAYAVTCHKSQGSSARVVVVVLENTKLLTREWLYTAITRARQQVIIVGTRENLANAIGRRTFRITGFNIEV